MSIFSADDADDDTRHDIHLWLDFRHRTGDVLIKGVDFRKDVFLDNGILLVTENMRTHYVEPSMVKYITIDEK